MTNEEIKKLAQSYVDELFAVDDMQDQENIEAKNDAFVMCMAFAGHILENHCIVEKSKVKELYAKTESDHCHVDEDNDWVVDMMLGRMEDIFGKDMFQEEKK